VALPVRAGSMHARLPQTKSARRGAFHPQPSHHRAARAAFVALRQWVCRVEYGGGGGAEEHAGLLDRHGGGSKLATVPLARLHLHQPQPPQLAGVQLAERKHHQDTVF